MPYPLTMPEQCEYPASRAFRVGDIIVKRGARVSVLDLQRRKARLEPGDAYQVMPRTCGCCYQLRDLAAPASAFDPDHDDYTAPFVEAEFVRVVRGEARDKRYCWNLFVRCAESA